MVGNGNCASKKELLQSINQVALLLMTFFFFWIPIRGKNGHWNISVNSVPEEMSF